jgi:hypothetical protein
MDPWTLLGLKDIDPGEADLQVSTMFWSKEYM